MDKKRSIGKDSKNLDSYSQFLYFKQHMKHLKESQREKITKGMPHKMKKALGIEEEHYIN